MYSPASASIMINATTLVDSVRLLRLGDRATLAQAMTLVESHHPRHQALSTQLLDAIMPFTGRALRLGITGTPGAGKSTFLEVFGMLLIRRGLRVAVIAVDPSSPVSGGSILGDKTRMTQLARAEGAFIRPVPSSGHLGGASQRARELMLLCEAANFDVVIVETVGVGQSETEVAHMVDCFISLQTAGGGDEIQGIKKGLMEMADLIVINKDDGDNRNQVAIARHMYESALHILRRKYDEWQPRVLTCSALEKRGIEEIWQAISDFQTRLTDNGRLEKNRQLQALDWLQKQTEEEALHLLFTHADFKRYFQQTLLSVKKNDLSPRAGLRHISEFIQHHYFE
jgi:LAO/AO transport system kinase